MNTQDKNEIRELVEEACRELNYDNIVCDKPEAIELMCGTWAQESAGGKHVTQLNNGPARGMWQVEYPTYIDTITRCKPFHYNVLLKTSGYSDIKTKESFNSMVVNHKFCAQVARIKYFLSPGVIPKTLEEQAAYYKKYYNTPLGKATEEEYIENYRRYVNNI